MKWSADEVGEVTPAVVTVTLTAPAVATRLAGIATGSVELPTRVAVRGVAPKFAIIGEVKLVPEMFSVKAPKPAGTRILPPVEVMIGGAGFTVKETPLTATFPLAPSLPRVPASPSRASTWRACART